MATPTYTPIETYTVTGSAVSSVTLGSGGTIPSTYTDLIVVVNASLTSGTSVWGVRFNGDTGSNYSWTSLRGDGSSATSTRDTGSNRILCGWFGTSKSTGIVQIQNYANTTTYKTVITRSNATDSGTYVNAAVGLWRGSTGSATQAITSVTVLPDSSTWPVGSTFTLYGIANAAIGAPKAQGGIITYDNTYFYHTFGASGTFTPQQSLTVDYLVVAGGGGSGSDSASGGGAGGLRTVSSASVTATGYSVIVGSGGAGGVAGGADGSIGGNSSFNSTSATGGGGGGFNNNGGAGGSGGGGGDNATNKIGGAGNAGSYSPVEGYAGGNGYFTGSPFVRGGAGGGGAGGVGSAGLSTGGGNGGIGATSTFINAIGQATGTGQLVSGNYYYAGGGGGSAYDNTKTAGTGGYGGGASASVVYATGGFNGTVNTGGGGACGGGSGSTTGGNGGSGVVIIRYLKA